MRATGPLENACILNRRPDQNLHTRVQQDSQQPKVETAQMPKAHEWITKCVHPYTENHSAGHPVPRPRAEPQG